MIYLNRTRLCAPRLVYSAVLAAVLIVGPLSAHAAPIVFDFEDQTSQGWRLQNAFLHPTSGVFSDGLDWAIFGFDGSVMRMSLDLTNVASMIWEEFVPSNTSFAFIIVSPGNTPPFDLLGQGIPLSPKNPRERFFDLSMLTGIHTIDIAWNLLIPSPGEQFPAPTLFNTGFINTITFHPVPEPSGLTLFGLLALVGGREVLRFCAAR